MMVVSVVAWAPEFGSLGSTTDMSSGPVGTMSGVGVGLVAVVTWATVWLTACWTDDEAAACCGVVVVLDVVVVLEAHPAKSGVSAHWVWVGTTLQPASEELAVH